MPSIVPVDIFWLYVNTLLGFLFLYWSRAMVLLQRPENFPPPARKRFQLWRLSPAHITVGCLLIGQTFLIALLLWGWRLSGVQDMLLPIGVVEYALLYWFFIRDVIALEREMVRSYADHPRKEQEAQAHISRSVSAYIFVTAFMEAGVSFALFDIEYLPALPQLAAAAYTGGIFLLSYLMMRIASQIVKAVREKGRREYSNSR